MAACSACKCVGLSHARRSECKLASSAPGPRQDLRKHGRPSVYKRRGIPTRCARPLACIRRWFHRQSVLRGRAATHDTKHVHEHAGSYDPPDGRDREDQCGTIPLEPAAAMCGAARHHKARAPRRDKPPSGWSACANRVSQTFVVGSNRSTDRNTFGGRAARKAPISSIRAIPAQGDCTSRRAKRKESRAASWGPEAGPPHGHMGSPLGVRDTGQIWR